MWILLNYPSDNSRKVNNLILQKSWPICWSELLRNYVLEFRDPISHSCYPYAVLRGRFSTLHLMCMSTTLHGYHYFKGTLTWDFRPTSPGSLIHRLKHFRIWLRIREDNRQSWLHSDTAVQPTFFSNIFANHSTHCFYKEIWLGCTWHSGVIDTAVTLDLIFEWL
jgi:hypothetical protein